MARTYVPYLMIVGRDGIIHKEHPGRDRLFWAKQEQNMRKEFGELLAGSRSSD